MFDIFFANSYIDVQYEGRIYLRDSYDSLRKKMNDSNSYINVTAIDFLGFEDSRTFDKKKITYYGSN